MSALTAQFRVSTAQVVAANGPQAGAVATTDVFCEANVYIAMSAAGTTVTPVLEVSPDNATWFTHTTGPAITATGNTLIKLTGNLGRYLRINYTAVTGSFTADAWIECKKLGAA